MEYVILYVMLFVFTWKKDKKEKRHEKQKKTRTIFSSASFGRMEESIRKDKIISAKKKKIKTVQIADPDFPLEVKLNVGMAHRLKRVDVYVEDEPITTSDAVEHDGMMYVVFAPSGKTGSVQFKVTDAGTQNVISSETIIFEEVEDVAKND